VGAEPKSGGWRKVDHSAKRNAPEKAAIPTVYPGVQDLAVAAPIEVGTGARVTGIDITLLRSRVFAVSGRVDGAAAGRVGITLTECGIGPNIRDFDLRTTTLNADGDFEMRRVPPGSYLVTAQQGESLQGSVPVEVSSRDIEGLRIALSQGGEVKGQFTAEGGKNPNLAGAYVFLSTGGRRGHMAKVNNDLTFVLRNLTSERHYVRYGGIAPGFYVKSIRAGETDVLSEGLTVPQGGTVSLEILLGAGGGRIEGGIFDKDEQPVSSATVVLAPNAGLRGRADLFRAATTNQYGGYEFRFVPPGDYKLFSWADVEPGAWHDPDFLRDFEGRGTAVTVVENGHEIVKLHLISSAQQ
jgi:hypothetical protein